MDTIIIMNKNVIPAGAMTESLASGIIDLAEVRNYNVQFTATGSPVGSYNVLISNDGIGFDLLAAALSVTTAGTLHIKDSNIGYRYVQVIYTFISGTGTLNASICGKQ